MSQNSTNDSPAASAQNAAATEKNTNPWDKRPDENSSWYARFTTYLNLGPQRTIEKLYRERKKTERGLKGQRPTGHWHLKAREFRWEERATAYDLFKQQQLNEQEESRKLDARELRREIVEELLAEVRRGIGNAQIATMDLDTARRFLPHLGKLLNDLLTAHRLEMGEPTSIEVTDNTTSISFNADDLAEATRQLEELYA